MGSDMVEKINSAVRIADPFVHEVNRNAAASPTSRHRFGIKKRLDVFQTYACGYQVSREEVDAICWTVIRDARSQGVECLQPMPSAYG